MPSQVELNEAAAGRLAFSLFASFLGLTLLAVCAGLGGERDRLADRGQALPVSPAVSERLRLAQAGREGELAKGKFLIASRGLSDPNFAQTVVLLVEYGREGAMGLIINRATEVKLSDLLPEMETLEERDDTVFIGGPVERSGMLLLIRSESKPDETIHVFGDIYLSSSRTLLENLVNSNTDEAAFRVYAGHAGWSPGQLDGEVRMEAWHILPADAATVFDPAPSRVWERLIEDTKLWFASRSTTRNPSPRDAG